MGRFGAVLKWDEVIQPTVLDSDWDQMERSRHSTTTLPVSMPPRFTGEETILLRSLAARSTIKQIGRQLRLSPTALLRQLSDLRRRVCVADDIELAAWARRWKLMASPPDHGRM